MSRDAGPAVGAQPVPVAPWRVVANAFMATLRHGGTRLAAALTYYATLSIAPAVIVLVSLIGLFGGGAGDRASDVLEAIGEVAPPAVVEALEGPVVSVTRGDYAGQFFWIGLAIALWAASGYVGAFIWTAEVVHGATRHEPLWRRLPRQFAIAAAALVALALMTAIVVASGPVARWLGDVLGLGETALTVWSYGRWVLFLAVATGIFGMLYRLAPSGQATRLRWVSLGGVTAALLALVASVGFSFYVAHIGSYDKTYGALATFVIFLVWLWLVNLMLVFGFELNVTLAGRRRPSQVT